MADTVEAALYAQFEAFCSFGERDAVAALDSFRWTKLLREAGLLTPDCPSASSDVVFARVCPRGQRRLSFDDFVVALGMLAEMKFPGDPQGFARAVTAVLRCPGPAVSAAASPARATGIFAKLTDPALYTGVHALRFDPASGRGLGLAGRDSVPHGAGTHRVWREGAPVADLADLLRPTLQRGGTHVSSEQARRRRERMPVVSPEFSPRRAPPASSHYDSGVGGTPRSPASPAPSAGAPRGSPRPLPSSAPGGGGGSSPTPRLRVAATPDEGGGGDAGDLSHLASIYAAYCLFGGTAASTSGDEMTSFAFAKLCRESGLVGTGAGCVPPASVDVAFSRARGPGRKRLQYDGFLFALQLLALECYPAEAEADPLGVTARVAARVVAAGGPALNVSEPVARMVASSALGSPTGGMPRIFAKLTDHRLFTGSHVHRFDAATGAGRGRAGREHVPGVDDDEAEIGRARAGPNVADLSQILRPGLN